jgi:sulfur transfer protein SufE
MQQPKQKAKRNWEKIAEEASHEQDTRRLIELTKELERALDEQENKLSRQAKSVPGSKSA